MVLVERYCPKCGAAASSNIPVCRVCGTSFKATIPLGDETAAEIFTSLRLTQHLQANELFRQRYQIVRQVGLGGFGAVYEAVDTYEKRQIAIKEFSLANLSARQIIDATNSFNREVELLTYLKHHSIPRIYEHLTDAEHWYVVMDYIPGKTLEELLMMEDDRRLPLAQVLRIGIQLCSVLDYLHRQRPVVIFRDIKPANIILSPEQKLYLVDFGVARQYKAGKDRDTIAFGSPGYAAPEQYGRIQTTPRSDLYSLGALLHQMLSGQDPSLDPFHFQGLRTYNRKLPTELEKLVAQMLEIDMERRPVSADAVRRKLQSIASTSRTNSKKDKKAGGSVRHFPPLSSADALARTFSTIGIPASIYREHRGPVRSLAWSPNGSLIASSDDKHFLHVWDALRPHFCWFLPWGNYDAAWSPDGQILASISGSRLDQSADGQTFITIGGSLINLWELPGKLSDRFIFWKKLALRMGFYQQRYRSHQTNVTALSWSPNGSQIASVERSGSIHVWDIQTCKQLHTYHKHRDIVLDIAWAPAGQRVASAGNDHTVQVWSAAGGDNFWHWDVGKRRVARTLAWSPNGYYLACGLSNGNVYIWDSLRGWKEYMCYGHKSAVNTVAWSSDGQRLASASDDGTVHIRDIQARKTAFIYREHETEVLALAWSPDGQYLASGDLDGLVHVWKTV